MNLFIYLFMCVRIKKSFSYNLIKELRMLKSEVANRIGLEM